MAQTPTDQNFYHSHSHPPNQQQHQQHQLHHEQTTHNASQHSAHHAQMAPQFRNPFDVLFDDRAGINYNYVRPYAPNQVARSEELNDASLVMRRPRRTRTTFTGAQIAELEQQFLHTKYLSSSRLAELSAKLALGTAQVKIWFKNRRRRHKIQSDQQREYFSSSLNGHTPLSISSALHCMQDDSARGGCSLLPPNMQTLSLGANAGAAALTPSPTPSAAAASLLESFSDAFNASQYYYSHNNPPPHGGVHPAHTQAGPLPALLGLQQMSQTQPGPHMLAQQAQQQPYLHPRPYAPTGVAGSDAAAVAAAAHYFAPPTAAVRQPQPQPHLPKPLLCQDQRQRYHDYSPYKTTPFTDPLASGFNERSLAVKAEPDFNFNNPYYMHMPEAEDATSGGAECAAGVAPAAALSPNPHTDNYEPLTPQNDDSPSLSNSNNSASSNSSSSSASSINSSNGVGVAAEHMEDESGITKTLQTLKPMRNNVAAADSSTCSTGYSAAVGAANNINMSECTGGAFSKYTKLTAITSDAHEAASNYQCTMDTLMHTYNTHHTTASSTQFAYCFN